MATGDPAIDAAFGDSSDSAGASQSTGDEAIDAAFPSSSGPSGSQHMKDVGSYFYKHPLTAGIGLLENAASGVTGGVGSLADAVTGADPGTHDWAYRPRTEAGKEAAGLLGTEMHNIGNTYDKVAGTGPLAQTLKERIPEAAGAIGTVTGILNPLRGTAVDIPLGGSKMPPPVVEPSAPNEVNPEMKDILEKSYAKQSMGAASNPPDISGASPQLQRAIIDSARKNGGAVNPTALENHLEADKFHVQLMDGQASRDPVQYSNEQNSVDPAIVSRINSQNGQLVDAFDNLRREASPTNVSNSPRENGQVVVDELKAYDEPVKADIKAKYDAANASAVGGQLQMDGSSFVDRANAALRPQGRAKFLPSQVRGILNEVEDSEGKMSLDDFQGYSTQLSNELRKAQRAGDGNAAMAISKVYDELTDTPPASTESAAAKGLYDQARSAAKARFDALRADPAYSAAVDEATGPGAIRRGTPSPLADTFLDDYALGRGAPKSQVDMMIGKLSDEGRGALTSHTLSAIRKSAVGSTGNVTPAGYNTALAKYSDKLPSLVHPDTAENLESLGRVIQNAKSAPPGHFVNYSKSGVITNAAKGVAQHAGEAALNAKTLGMGVPIMKGIIQRNFSQSALKPGAGLTRLSDVMNPGANP